MGLLKHHFHDEICAAEPSPDPYPHEVGPFPMPPVHVVMERNAVTGESIPVFVCNHIADANAVMLMRNAGRYLTNDPESFDYYVKEAVPCLG